MTNHTAAEMKFINEYTRTLLVEWCCLQVKGTPPLGNHPAATPDNLFWQHALTKKWVSKRDGSILTPGFQTAANFLKR